MTSEVAAAYDATGQAWADGPVRVYGRIASMLCDRLPIELAGARVLDVGAGTGAATARAIDRGASVVGLDLAPGMLAARAAGSGPGVAADARVLPFVHGSFDGVLAAFSLNHLPDPATGLAEARRVLRRGGGLAACVYAEDGNDHPVKAAVEAAAAAAGWASPSWYEELRQRAVPELATPGRAVRVAARAGLGGAEAVVVHVSHPHLTADDLVAWRLGMAQHASFLAALPSTERSALVRRARDRLGDSCPMLVSRVVVLTWRRPG